MKLWRAAYGPTGVILPPKILEDIRSSRKVVSVDRRRISSEIFYRGGMLQERGQYIWYELSDRCIDISR